jgi:hypothetical protein
LTPVLALQLDTFRHAAMRRFIIRDSVFIHKPNELAQTMPINRPWEAGAGSMDSAQICVNSDTFTVQDLSWSHVLMFK